MYRGEVRIIASSWIALLFRAGFTSNSSYFIAELRIRDTETYAVFPITCDSDTCQT